MTTNSAVPVPASHLDAARDAEVATRAANAAMAAKLPFSDTRDFEAAKRGHELRTVGREGEIIRLVEQTPTALGQTLILEHSGKRHRLALRSL